jgi:hypothetical protein
MVVFVAKHRMNAAEGSCRRCTERTGGGERVGMRIYNRS